MDRERTIFALKLVKNYCKSEDCKALLGPKLMNILTSKKLNNPIKAMALKCLGGYDYSADEIVAKLSDESMTSSIIQCALKQHFNYKSAFSAQKSTSALANLILSSE